ncbi:MAG: thioredoxin [Gemmatimonadetes bacterium]|nr:MAG: thioredoxin [Gemmatimonadota bacterium]
MNIQTLTEFNQIWSQEGGALFYFTRPACPVCLHLKPRVKSLVDTEFPELGFYEIDCEGAPGIAPQMQVFAVPAVIVAIHQHEICRFSRHFGIDQLRRQIARSYPLWFTSSTD